MASGDGIITRQEIITDEALYFGKEYRKNADDVIRATDEMIERFRIYAKITKEYRKAESEAEYRKNLEAERLENERILNLLKQRAFSEKELERIKREKLKTEKEAIKVAQENIRMSKMQEAQQRSSKNLTMEERVQRQLANKADKDAVLEKMGLIGAYQKLNKQRTEAKKRLQDLIAAEGASNREIRKAQQEFDRLDAKVRKADNATRDFTKNVGNYKSAFTGLSNLMGAFGIIGGVAGAVELGKSIFNTTKQLQVLHKAMELGAKTPEDYAKNIEFLKRITEEYGLELLSTSEAYNKFYTSAKNKLAISDIQMIFEKVSKAAALMGLSVEQQEGTFKALSDMMSKGNIQAEELKGQLGDRIPVAVEAMAKAVGVGTAELLKMMQNGEIMAADVLPKFAIELEKAVGADQVKRVETLAAAQNRASNKWTEFVENLNNGEGVITKVGMGFFNLTGKVLDLIGAEEDLSETIFEEQLALNDLINRITSTNVSNSERLDLIEELKRNYPDFIGMIDDEDFSNKNLRKTLSLVNEEYKNRILLQRQVENVTEAEQNRFKKLNDAASMQLKLYNALNELNVKNNLGVQLDPSNAVEKVEEIASKSSKIRGFSGINAAGLRAMAAAVKTYREEGEKLNDEVEKEKNIRDSIQKTSGLRNEEERKSINNIRDYNKSLEERIALAVKLGGVVGKDFSEFDLNGIDKYISSKQNASTGESDKDRNKREAAERKAIREREKAIKEAEKLETDRLKKEKESYEAGIDLLIYKKNAEAEIFKAESVNEKNSQEERYNALISFQKAEEEALKLNYEKQLTLSRAFQKDRTTFTEEEKKYMLENKSILSDVSTLTNAELLILEKYYAEQEKLRLENQKGIKENVEFEANRLKKEIQEKVKAGTSNNNANEAAEINALSIGNNLADVENYEKAVYDIKRKYLLKNLEDELAVYNTIIESEKKKGKVNQDVLDKQLELENQIREFKNESHIISLEKAKEMEQRFIEMGENIKNALVDLTNAIFDNRIQRIDEDIERSDEQYERQIELYEGDAARQKAIREQQEREREKLEAKKRKEQHKQAVFNKAMAIADIGWSTAQAIIKAMADPGGYAGIALAIGAGIAGAVQTAAVLATPIPKYKMGRKDGPEEIAIVGDGGVREVVEHPDGSAYITPNRDTVVKLFEGDVVHSSIDKYRESQRATSLNGLQRSQNIMGAYLKEKEYRSDEGLIKEIRELHRTLKNKNMTTTVNIPKMDLGHELWRLKQIGGL